jgi:membrane protein implicated in regulation of membrane protease activity
MAAAMNDESVTTDPPAVRPYRVPPSVWIGLVATVLGVIVVLSGGFGWLAALLVPAVVLSVFLSFHVVRKLLLWDDGVAGEPESKKEERKEEG